MKAEDWNRLVFIDEPLCFQCGLPLEYASMESVTENKHAEENLCLYCINRPKTFIDQTRSAMIYNHYSRKLILEFKYGQRRDTLYMMAQLMTRIARNIIYKNALLVPVPLHWSRLIERRYNQSALLVKAISKQTKTPVDYSLLKRPFYTENQGGKSYLSRQKNVQNAFKASEKQCLKYQDKTIILIDDVMTTGATLNACAKALKQKGIKHVCAITLLRVAFL